MDPGHLTELIDLEENYWWHVAKRKLVTEILTTEFPPPGLVIEGGIGSARNLLEFNRLGYEVTGFDLMQEAVDHGRSRGLENVFVHELSQPWPVAPASAKAVLLLDVMEHMEDPVELLKNAAETLTEDGGIIITVPAYPMLYSDWDRKLGHFCRYTKLKFRHNAEQAGLKVKWVTHWNSFTLPAAIAIRGRDKILKRTDDSPPCFTRVSRFTNACLKSFAQIERKLIHSTGVPFGLSLVGVLTK
ncbi:class I SAM-dependent methyltransferase [Gimesia fumaroli]|uniref:Methyltransferase domain protein n=1 Tax=Gimesia fumaroli TaxID=2527976 RepID=A0A518IBR7_9PLAN|nr:class I SAM-dependent methyltransferase [Gimesia fumaroli]QDV50545.1 Methyltransferase domain protein [Gimesia fumaroli]